MIKIWNEIKTFSKNIKYGLGITRKICPGYLLVSCASAIMNIFVGYFDSVIFMKLLLDSFQKQRNFEQMYPIFIAAIIINGIACIVNAIKTHFYDLKIQLKLNKCLKEMVYKKAQSLAFRQYYSLDIKNTMNLVVSNITMILLGMIMTIAGIFATIFQTILNAITLIFVGGKEAFILIPILIAVCIYKQVVQVKINKENYQQDIEVNEVNRRKYYYSGGVFMNKQQNQVIRVYDCFSMIKEKFIKTFADQKVVTLKHKRKNFEWDLQRQLIQGAFLNIATFVILGYRAICLKNLTAGDFWAVYYAYNSLGGGNVFNIYSQVQNSSQWIQYIHNFFDTEEEQTGTLPVNLENDDWELEFDKVSFIYPTEGQYVLKDVSFRLRKGQLVTMVGENGAGKSTIILLILRLFDPISGCIRLNGVDIKEYDVKQYRSCFANLYQNYKIIPLTVAQNISLTYDTSEVEGRVRDCLHNALIDQKIDSLENGIHTSMTKDYDIEGYVPSGGELRKLGLAHNFYTDAPIMILDEFDSEMDPISESELNQTIIENKRELGIVVTHRLSICVDCDQILYFSRGKLVEQGTHDELIEKNGEYANIYRTKQKLYGKM